LRFEELFPSALRKRIENTPGGPLTAIRQDSPGIDFCTESDSLPSFHRDSKRHWFGYDGTRLLAEFSKIPPPVIRVDRSQ